MVVDRRHRLDDDDLLPQEVDDQPAAVQQLRRPPRVSIPEEGHDPVDLVVDVVQPELRGLVGGLEEPLFRVRQLVERLLQLEELGHPYVALVVGVAAAGEEGSGN